MIFDYMQLYEICDTSIKVKESSSLDFVASKLVGVEKIKYNGSLQKLYEDDFETFMYYNAVDSVLVQKIHDSRNYISIIYAISSLAKIRIVDVVSQMNNALGSLAITEGVLRNRFREMDNIVLFKDENRESGSGEGIAGGWVKDPIVGMNRWVVVYDFASLYPTTQRQFFISPENFLGEQDPNNKDFCKNGRPIDKDKHVICVNGVVFEKRLSPTLRMLEDVYADRKYNKGIMMKKKEELNTIMEQIKELEESL
jgi:DNA polymerase elongation subunit (family B)